VDIDVIYIKEECSGVSSLYVLESSYECEQMLAPIKNTDGIKSVLKCLDLP
jgi:hypothetical protein